jgi:hypothetical protein
VPFGSAERQRLPLLRRPPHTGGPRSPYPRLCAIRPCRQANLRPALMARRRRSTPITPTPRRTALAAESQPPSTSARGSWPRSRFLPDADRPPWRPPLRPRSPAAGPNRRPKGVAPLEAALVRQPDRQASIERRPRRRRIRHLRLGSQTVDAGRSSGSSERLQARPAKTRSSRSRTSPASVTRSLERPLYYGFRFSALDSQIDAPITSRRLQSL